MEKYIVIGDIHGCPEQLEEILDKTSKYKDHKYIFLGDYVDRGPDSEKVINILREIDAVFLLGNHEVMLTEQIRRWGEKYYGDPFLNTKLSKKSVEWLETVPLPVYETDDYIFVHAGFNKNLDLSQQTNHDYLWSHETGDYRQLTEKTVIHGHTVVENPEIVGNRININTGCGVQGKLTALVLPEMEFYQSSKSPGVKLDWEQLKKDLEEELRQYDDFATLEEVTD